MLEDVDGDGDLDMIVANDGLPSRIWNNNGSGVYTAGQEFNLSNDTSIAVGDINSDGDLDSVVTTHGLISFNRILSNQ